MGEALMEGGSNLDLVLSFNVEDYLLQDREQANLCFPRLLTYYTTTSATLKRLIHNEMYRLFVSCKPWVLCNDVVGVLQSFIRWNCDTARIARTCVKSLKL